MVLNKLEHDVVMECSVGVGTRSWYDVHLFERITKIKV